MSKGKSYMTPKELRKHMFTLYGTRVGAQRKLAKDIGRHEVTVSRWMRGETMVDKSTAAFIRLLAKNAEQESTDLGDLM